ncbi:hypothetical protein FQN57_004886 [Myotisia sp. PD_48]|nr:hypothetical protein FQN57_004886 [Myotisia sp. PD_48]
MDEPPPLATTPDSLQAIDDLLERYLHLLDEQQTLQKNIGRLFSDGFFSVARANQSCPPGRHFGEDYYDERMKAIKKLNITMQSTARYASLASPTQEPDSHIPNFDISPLIRPDDPIPNDQNSAEEEEKSSTSKASSTKPGLEQEIANNASTTSTKPGHEEEKIRIVSTTSVTKPDPKQIKANNASNPLQWFGILVPPALRRAQESFSAAVDGPLPRLASVIAEMRDIESKVDKLRALSHENK